MTEGTAPLTVQFTDTSTGEVTGWLWDFGDGTTSTEQNPSHTYNAAGTYTATLTVSGPGGTSEPSTTTINVLAGAPTASFTTDVTEGTAPLTVQFTDTSTGEVTGWLWDFGDGTTSTEQNPVHTYEAAGTYTATLTVSGSGGTSEPSTTTITVTDAGGGEEPNPLEDVPVVPEFDDQQVIDALRQVYDAGQSVGNRAGVLSVVGDTTVLTPGYGNIFADPTQYVLEPDNTDLQAIIDFYNATDLNGQTSFNRIGLARNPNWTAASLLDPTQADPGQCQPGESPLACELRVNQPAVLLVSIGYNDVIVGTDLEQFRQSIRDLLQTALDANVIPVISTIPPRTDGLVTAEQTQAYNEVIVEVAEELEVPVFNLWRSFNELPESGLGFDLVSPSVAPTGPGDLSASATSTYGLNAANVNLLRLLDVIREAIFPEVTLP
ncbi:MAG: PKD domain-containing protein [bacterium]|nr:PKD domain-containing protein [bacterium]